MGKQGSSTTTQQQQIPQWLTAIMQPYMKESVGNALNMQRQGNAVLQGKDYKGVDLTDVTAPRQYQRNGKLDPEVLDAYYRQRGQ